MCHVRWLRGVVHAMWASRNHVCDMNRACVARASCPTTLSTGARTTPWVAAAKTWYVRMWYGHVCVMWLFMQCVLACVFVCVCTQDDQFLCVTYYAISGATQSGPNVFWTLAALKYVAASGNYTWLREHMPNLRLAAEFLTNLYDAEYGLLSVPGSLFIDTFRRYNLTTDTNAAMVYVWASVP